MAVRSALPFVFRMRIPIGYLIHVCFIWLIFFASSFLIFNVYAQQGGAASGGSATGGSNVAGPAYCYGQCYFYGPSATGGSATGGNALGSGSGDNKGSQAQIPSNSINTPYSQSNTSNIKSLIDKGISFLDLQMHNKSLPYLDKALAIDPNNKYAQDQKAIAVEKLNNNNSQ